MHFSCISDQIVVDILRWLSHIHFLFVVKSSKKVRQSSAMVKMGVRNNNHRELLWIDPIKQRQAVSILLIDHESTIEHNLFVVDSEYEARSTHFTSCSQGHDRHLLHVNN